MLAQALLAESSLVGRFDRESSRIVLNAVLLEQDKAIRLCNEVIRCGWPGNRDVSI